jgi:hypothetical protein
VLAGCGGGSSFTSQANGICKSFTAKINAVAKPTTAAGLATFFDQTLPLVQQGTAKLKALKPPSNKATQYQAYIAVLEQEVAIIQQAAAAAHAGNTNQAVSLARQGGTLSAQDKAAAASLGLSECTK